MSLIHAPRPSRRTACRPRLETLEMRTLLSGLDAVEPKIGAAATRALYDVDGTGHSAAFIDTGVDYTHEALGKGYGAGYKVVDGYDFSREIANPYPLNQHGTMTAGLAAGDAANYQGVAPGANIVGLRVIGDDGSGDFDRVIRALQYAIDNAAKDKISVVNISLSDGGNYSYDFFSRDNSVGQKVAKLVHKLAEMRIPVVTAAGNSYDGSPGMGFTAILPETISVTATDKNDVLLPNAQRLGPLDGFAAATDLAAPGKDIEAPAGGGYTGAEGTSFSAPLVTGAIILLQEIYEKRFGVLPLVSDLEAWLKGGATKIHDPVSGIDIGRLDILKSASLIPSPIPAPQTDIYVDGVLKVTVPSSSTSNPLSDFGADAGFVASFDLVQFWQNGGSTTITSVPGGSTVNDIGAQFTKVEIWNAQPTGKATGTSNDVHQRFRPTTAATSSDTVRIGQAKNFRAKMVKADRVPSRHPKFARFGKGR